LCDFCDLLEGAVEVDQTVIPFRAGDAFFEPSGAGRPKPRRKGAKDLDTRSGRLRLAVIADNSPKSIEAFGLELGRGEGLPRSGRHHSPSLLP